MAMVKLTFQQTSVLSTCLTGTR